MKQFKTREELLQDTIDYYWGKPERKCVVSKESDTCQYSANDTSLGCAIGRLVDKKLARQLDIANNSVNEKQVFDSLPLWLQNHGQKFLIELQHIHDFSYLAYKKVVEVKQSMKNFVNFDNIVFPE